MSKILGDYIEEFPKDLDSLEISFNPTVRSIKKRWVNNRLSAQFAADYFSAFLPVDDDDPKANRRIIESKGAVSYVANELLENAMKFNDEASKFKVQFGIYFLEGDRKEVTAVLYATNSVSTEGAAKFENFLKELLAADPEEFYITQVEKSAEEDSDASGLGFLTMINDYEAKLGWKFAPSPQNSQILTVTSMAQVKV